MRARPVLLLSVAVVASAVPALTAHASPICIKERTPFALSHDTVKWTMSIAPGADCIQGLRWSYMQIFNVSVVSGPSRGQLAVVGSGFRYSAEPEARGSDKFTLLISGKNRHAAGTSTLEVEVNPQ
ncbi:Ig-like domain-containing protein [Bradyrhizobium sp. CNPSo 4010]|uniref:Ig-like domain-containing protein n=2 Tax=Bradyrhizobium agreste TaxID=2751811 RepID=A0ABS0PS01_9BRAD|nr:Ig-like domain-containing protein [Bradyrhizobium agreste]